MKMKSNQRIAKHETEGIILASKYNGGNITCFECNEPLSFVSQHTRNGNPVVAHFRHQPNSERKGESIEHRVAKSLIVKNHDQFKFIAKCQCGTRHPLILEGQYEEELTWKQYKLDIGVKDGDNLIGAIEILHTHSIPDDKIQTFNENNIIWYEVKAREVINVFETGGSIIPIVRMKNTLCPQCRHIGAVNQERIALSSRISIMIDEISPFHSYMLRMRKVSEEAIRELKINEIELHIRLASIANQFETLHKGRFKGLSIVSAYVIAPDYVRWIAREGEGKGFTQGQLETAKRIMRGRCLYCAEPSSETQCSRCHSRQKQ
jgi:hypothetical protein